MVMEVLPLPRDGVRAPKTIFALLNVVVVHYGCGRQLQDLTIITESGPCVSVNIVRFPYPLRKWHSWQLGNLTSVNTASFCIYLSLLPVNCGDPTASETTHLM